MMDHKGANFEALERVYRDDFRKYKTVTCQWHFLHCAEKYISKCSESERQSFRTWCKHLCQAHTWKEYRRLQTLIKGVAKEVRFYAMVEMVGTKVPTFMSCYPWVQSASHSFVNKETPCGILLHKGTCSSP